MNSESPFRLVASEPARKKAQALFDQVQGMLAGSLPAESEIRHIGATAIPGCLTKGDLDIVIRVPPEAFPEMDAVLARHFARNYGSVRTDNFSAFEDASCNPHLGIQLTAIGGASDFFHLFLDALIRSPELLREYNELKRRFDGSDMAAYRAAKDTFVERVIAEVKVQE